MTDLPPLGSVKDCPKCGTHYGYGEGNQPKTTEYSPGLEWHPERFLLHGPNCCWELSAEHISRECLICGFRWAEAIFQPEQLGLPE